MAMRCIKCWKKVSDDPIIIADDFDGCFCQECFDEPANEFLELIYAFIDSSYQAEANELFSQIEDLSESLGLSEDGQDILFGFLNHKLSEMQSLQDIDINMINEHTNRIQSMPEAEIRKMELKKNFIAVTTNNIEGYRIIEYHGIATGTSVMGKGFFSSSNNLGYEKSDLCKKIEEVKSQAMDYAIDNATSMGGNALIATSVGFNTITNSVRSGFGTSSVDLAVMVSGTAVTIEKLSE